MAKIGDRFVAMVNFFSEEQGCAYESTLGYTIQSEKLLGLVEKWIAEGKVKIVEGKAELSATGEVK